MSWCVRSRGAMEHRLPSRIANNCVPFVAKKAVLRVCHRAKVMGSNKRPLRGHMTGLVWKKTD